MSYYVANPKNKDDIVICEEFTRGACQKQCPLLHHPKNYLWQVYIEGLGWLFVKDSDNIEHSYIQPANVHHVVQVQIYII